MNNTKPKKREGTLRGTHLPKGEVVPLMSDVLFKKVYGDSNHLERLNYLLSSIFNKEVNVIKILNDELLGEYRLNSTKYVDLVCKIGEFDYVNVEVNTSYAAYEIDRNVDFIFRLASSGRKPDEKMSREEKRKYRRAKRHYIQINLNNVNTNKKPYITFSLNDNEDSTFKLTDEVEIININVSHYLEMCYTKGINELSDFELAVGIIGVYQEKLLNRLSKRNKILEEIGDIVKKYSWVDDVIVAYDREEYLKEAYEANIEYAVADAVEETTKRVTEEVTKEVTKEVTEKNTLDMAKKMKDAGVSIDIIVNITGLSKEEIESL